MQRDSPGVAIGHTATANTVYDMNPTSEAASIVRTWYTAIASASPVGPVAAASASTQ